MPGYDLKECTYNLTSSQIRPFWPVCRTVLPVYYGPLSHLYSQPRTRTPIPSTCVHRRCGLVSRRQTWPTRPRRYRLSPNLQLATRRGRVTAWQHDTYAISTFDHWRKLKWTKTMERWCNVYSGWWLIIGFTSFMLFYKLFFFLFLSMYHAFISLISN